MVVPNNFPDGDAGAVRDNAFATIYQELGYDVYLIGKGQLHDDGVYNNIKYKSIFDGTPGIRGHASRFLHDYQAYINIIENWIDKIGLPSLIHINSIPERTISFLLNMAINNSIPIVHDSVEWYSPCEFKWGRLDKSYILKDRLNRKVIRNPIKVISISAYLDTHFKKRGITSCRIPVIMDVINTPSFETSSDKKISFIYAGTPGRKDYLKEIILGVNLLTDEEKDRICFKIIGVGHDYLSSLVGDVPISSCVHVYGRLSRKEVLHELKTSDFSVLLRPEKERYSKAGFPTKVVEAMSHGVAMICNISSDLGMYLEDMRNAVIAENSEPRDFYNAIRRVLKLERQDICRIKEAARKTAESFFDFRHYINDVEVLIHNKQFENCDAHEKT